MSIAVPACTELAAASAVLKGIVRESKLGLKPSGADGSLPGANVWPAGTHYQK